MQLTKPLLPEIPELMPYIQDIWQSGFVTNNGKYCKELKIKLTKFLNINDISLVSSGTFALWCALKALNIQGEVITTPYTFVATTNVLKQLNITPVYVDVKDDGTINPDKIEAAITDKTTAILAVHVHGFPCDVQKISEIAHKHNLKVIYDAAHAFNVKINGIPLVNYGDISTLSFHATKVYNTIEGGAVISNSEIVKQIDLLKNFGIVDEETTLCPGLNGKLDEIRSAIGILNLKTVTEAINKRKQIAEYYLKYLNIPGIQLPEYKDNIAYNYSYFPIYINSDIYGLTRDELFAKFRKESILVRKYFYPLLCDDSVNVPNARKLSNNVLCLPIYPELTNLENITKIICESL